MSRTLRLDRSYEPADTAQPGIVFNELVDFIEAGQQEMVKDKLSAGMTLTIPADFQYIVFNAFDNEGDITLEGTMVIL